MFSTSADSELHVYLSIDTMANLVASQEVSLNLVHSVSNLTIQSNQLMHEGHQKLLEYKDLRSISQTLQQSNLGLHHKLTEVNNVISEKQQGLDAAARRESSQAEMILQNREKIIELQEKLGTAGHSLPPIRSAPCSTQDMRTEWNSTSELVNEQLHRTETVGSVEHSIA